MGQDDLTRFIVLSFLVHVGFILSTGYLSLENKKASPIHIRLVEILDSKEETIFPTSPSHSQIHENSDHMEMDTGEKGVSFQSADNKKKESKKGKFSDHLLNSHVKADKNVPDKKVYRKTDIVFEEQDYDKDTIPLDTKEFKYNSYFDSIKRKISSVWRYPEEAMSLGIGGSLTLRFSLSKDGTLLSVKLQKSTNYLILDNEAIRAIKIAAPFDKFPDTIEKSQLNIVATFSYKQYFISQNEML